MVKEKRILSYFIGWLVLGYIIFVIGINDVFAAEQKTGLGFLNNSSVYISNNKGADIQLTRQTVNNVSMDIKSIVFLSNYNIQANTVYEYEIEFHDVFLKNVDKATILSNNGICTLIGLSNSNDNNITDSYMVKWNSIYLWSITDTIDLGPIINNQSQNTQDILNNDNQNTNNIIENNNQNTQDIIDSNKETQDVIKDQFNSCRDSVNIAYSAIYNSLSYNWATLVQVTSTDMVEGEVYTISVDIDATGNSNAYWNEAGGVVPTKYFSVKQGLHRYTYTFTAIGSSQNIGVVLSKSGLNGGDSYTLTPSKIQIQKGNKATKYEEPNTEVCSNKIDDTNDKLDETNQNLGDIKDSLTDSSSPNTSGLENSAGWLPAGPLDSILNLPLTMLNSLTNSLSKTCSPLNLTLPYVNKQLQIPCLSAILAQITGVNGLWTWVGTIASVLILYNYLLNLYAWVDRVLTLRAEFDEAMGADLANWGRL